MPLTCHHCGKSLSRLQRLSEHIARFHDHEKTSPTSSDDQNGKKKVVSRKEYNKRLLVGADGPMVWEQSTDKTPLLDPSEQYGGDYDDESSADDR